MKVYYNDNDTFCCAWLRELMKEGLIPDGVVDERSIKDILPGDVAEFEQCHFFAGIGGWARALQLAQWKGPVWTGSCPCQPFSAAGKRKGNADERHLWPEFFRLIAECRPPVVFGEQVASKDGLQWLDGVRADLEGKDYAFGAADLCAASAGEKARARFDFEDHSFRWKDIVVGAPHIRQRLYWVADSNVTGHARVQSSGDPRISETRSICRAQSGFERRRVNDRMADADGGIAGNGGIQRSRQHGQQPQDDSLGGMGDPIGTGLEIGGCQPGDDGSERAPVERANEDAGGVEHTEEIGCGRRPYYENEGRRQCAPSDRRSDSFWSAFDIIACTDGKTRRVGPGIFPLAHGVPNRVGTLRGSGNAIVPQVAAEFIRAFVESRAG